MSDEQLLRRLERVQDYFVREGLGFDDYCMAVEEAIRTLTEQAARIEKVRTRAIDVGTYGAGCVICRGTWSHSRRGELHEDWCPIRQ